MAEKVRSDFFHSISQLQEKFHDHLKIAQGLSRSQLSVLLKYLSQSIQAETKRHELIARQELAKELGGNERELLNAHDVLYYIGKSWDPIRDDIETVLNDFEDLGFLPEDKERREVFSEFLQSYLEFLHADSARRVSNIFSGKFLPALNGLKSGIEFRSVIESDFDWSNEDPIDYEPIIKRTVPIVILEFSVSDSDPIIFQVKPENIKMIINKLQATLKDLEVSKDLIAR